MMNMWVKIDNFVFSLIIYIGDNLFSSKNIIQYFDVQKHAEDKRMPEVAWRIVGKKWNFTTIEVSSL